jgi:hypothetical protein
LLKKYLKLGKKHMEIQDQLLVTHLCIEYRINRIIEKRFKNPKALDRLNFFNKIRILDGLGLVDQDAIHDLIIINSVRNFFAHTLDVETEEFENKFLNKMKEKLDQQNKQFNKLISLVSKMYQDGEINKDTFNKLDEFLKSYYDDDNLAKDY